MAYGPQYFVLEMILDYVATVVKQLLLSINSIGVDDKEQVG